MSQLLDELPRECIDALETGNVVEAIKLFRTARQVGLKESRDAVGRYLECHPELAQRSKTVRTSRSSSALLWLLALLTAGVSAYLLLRAGD